MIRQIRVNGFQAFATPQVFHFSNLNLIYGPNSGGKSSLFRLLRILAANPLDRQLDRQFEFGDGAGSFGSFTDVVSNHDPNRTIDVGITLEIPLRDQRDVLANKEELARFHASSASIVEVEPGHWSANLDIEPYTPKKVRIYSISVGVDFSLSADGSISQLAITIPGSSVITPSGEEHLMPDVFLHLEREFDDDGPWFRFFSNMNNSFGNIETLSLVADILADENNFSQTRDSASLTVSDLSAQEIEAVNVAGVYYSPYTRSVVDEEGKIPTVARPIFLELERFLSTIFKIYDHKLQGLSHVGPLREIPKLIQENSSSLVKSSIADTDQTILAQIFDFKAPRRWFNTLTDGIFDFEVKPISAEGIDLQQSALFVSKKGSRTSFENVGVGLSQVLPILLEIFDPVGSNRKFCLVEQPELHLHPRMQSELADALLHATGLTPERPRNLFETQIFAETHSENFYLRIGRRIRETTQNLPEPEYSVRPENISVSYIEPTSLGSNVKRIRFDDQGELLEPMPISFAEIRFEDFLP